MARRERLSCVAGVTVSLIFILLCAGGLLWFFTHPLSRDRSYSGIEGLRRLIILTKPGKHYPATPIRGFKSDARAGSLRPDARESLRISGTILKDLYSEFLDHRKVGHLHTVSASLFSESGLALAEGLDLPITEYRNCSDYSEEELREKVPLIVHHLEHNESLPECIKEAAKFSPLYPTNDSSNSEDEGGETSDALFLAYRIAEDIDAMSDEEIPSLRINCTKEFLLKERPLISDELFVKLSMNLSETARDLVDDFRYEILQQLLQKDHPEKHVVSIYAFPEYHLQSLFGCLACLNLPEMRIFDNLILEIYDKMIRIRVNRVWMNWDLIDLLRSLNNNIKRCDSWLPNPDP